jgi:hypothetical protein
MRPNLRVPPFLDDLFRDLRDRRLLPLAAVLVVAILAVPFAFSKSESTPDLSGSGGQAGAGAEASTFSVTAGDPGLRDYKRRLRGDSPKDPFSQQYATSDVAGSTTGSGDAGSSTSGGSGAKGSGSSESSTSGTTGTGTEGGQPDSSGGGSEPPQPDQGGDESGPTYVLHLRLGPPDDTKPRELSAPAPLPGLDNPILVFRGLSSDGHKAVFRVSEDVSAIYGDAKCLKGTDRCQLVEIEPGLPVNFVYGAKDNVLRLTVTRIEHK